MLEERTLDADFEKIIDDWYSEVDDTEKAKKLDTLLKEYTDWKVAESISRRYWKNPEKLINILAKSKLHSIQKKDIKIIGMFFYRLVNGGIQNVMIALTKIFISMGYSVVLFTSLHEKDDYVELPKEVKRIVIPHDGLNKPDKYYLRARTFHESILAHRIDAFIYHAWSESMASFDMFLIKTISVPFIVHTHEVFSSPIRHICKNSLERLVYYSIADAIVCLGETNRVYWKKFNSNVHSVINPLLFDIKSCKPSSLKTKKLLWAGRISPEKRPEHALQIFNKVLEAEPTAILQVLGSGSAPYEASIKKLAVDLGISKSVEFCGFHTDVTPFFGDSSIFLFTSLGEGFGLVLFEAKAHGLPIILYEIPYLTISQGNKGMLPVEQEDIEDAARQVVKLLQDTDLRKKLGKESREHALELSEYDYKKEWQKIFGSLKERRKEVDIDIYEKYIWDVLLHYYNFGVKTTNNSIEQLTAKYKREMSKTRSSEKRYNDMKNSLSFRVGRLVTFFPRKVRGAFRRIKKDGFLHTLKYIKVFIKHYVGKN